MGSFFVLQLIKNNNMIRLAIQAKGRLNEDSIELLNEAGMSVGKSKRKLLTQSADFPIEVLYLRDDDIPQAVAMGIADIGIVGLNEVAEKQQDVDIAHNLGFSKCRISLAIPRDHEYNGPSYFNGKRVATSYPKILAQYFTEQGITAEIHEISGSVEIAPSVGMADAIFDIVSSGSTLVTNGLKEVEKVFLSEAVIVANKNLSDENKAILDQMLFRFESIERSKGMKYVLMNIPCDRVDAAVAILPGMKSPTILPLAQEGWCSLHAVIKDSELWQKIEELKSVDAEDILILALEKMIR